MSEPRTRKYLAGPIDSLLFLYPETDTTKERVSLDKTQLILEKDIEPSTIKEIEDLGIKVMSHEEALDFVNAVEAEGVWYDANSRIPEEESL